MGPTVVVRPYKRTGLQRSDPPHGSALMLMAPVEDYGRVTFSTERGVAGECRAEASAFPLALYRSVPLTVTPSFKGCAPGWPYITERKPRANIAALALFSTRLVAVAPRRSHGGGSGGKLRESPGIRPESPSGTATPRSRPSSLLSRLSVCEEPSC
ncbi:hypothetical protein SKAU_G00354730 [Synaphobranchus kaupii]|uniref:Uncharacterized protein n=1 Tax=Synaphobranchus kaupii TaxID=118154 RepID=A0A9Q1IGB9_SYNKA|nr:hypothetical protein SKAU_G00354730 [Synaphobranchus kaupii]